MRRGQTASMTPSSTKTSSWCSAWPPSSRAPFRVAGTVPRSSSPSWCSPTTAVVISPNRPHEAPELRRSPSSCPAELSRRAPASLGRAAPVSPNREPVGLPVPNGLRASAPHRSRWVEVDMRRALSTFVRRGLITRGVVPRGWGQGAPVCGIAGVIALADRGPDPSVIEHMTRQLAYRGGAAWGYYVDGRVGLGVACPGVVAPDRQDRLATNEERSVHVVLDGQLHNAPQVADGLLKAGHRFLTSTDAEVVAHAWEKYGERSLDLFTGIFALAVWDAQRRRLFLAVDRVGEKCLHYAITDGWL